jgi:chemotaxis protein MotB
MEADTTNNGLVLKPKQKKRIAPWIAVVGVLGTGGLGYLGWTQHNKIVAADAVRGQLEEDNKSLTNALELHRASKEDLGGQLNTCRDELTTEKTSHQAADTRLTGLETELTACRSSVKNLETEQAEAKALLAEFKELTGRFQKMIDSGKLDVAFRRGQMVVKLPDAILFPSGSADVSDEGRVALGEVAVVLKQVKNRRFTIAGHTDDVPVGKDDKFKSNWELSTARALAVTQVLIEKGVPPRSLVAAGYGQHDPIAANSTKAGRAKNRRIEIVLEPYIEKGLATADLPK